MPPPPNLVPTLVDNARRLRALAEDLVEIDIPETKDTLTHRDAQLTLQLLRETNSWIEGARTLLEL